MYLLVVGFFNVSVARVLLTTAFPMCLLLGVSEYFRVPRTCIINVYLELIIKVRLKPTETLGEVAIGVLGGLTVLHGPAPVTQEL